MEPFELNKERFIALLGKLIGDAKHVQNNPPAFVPQEDKIVAHVLEALGPHTAEKGGPLVVKQLSYTPGRSNLMVTYPGSGKGTVSFVGSHMDVVTANPAEWGRDPFALHVEGDNLYGRGTTDCLGHVAMITDLLIQLAESKVKLTRSVVVLFICNEENSSIEGIGVDEVVRRGEIEHLKQGPVYWVDSADEHPCIGTGGVTTWKLTFHGKVGHSGLPHNAINPIIGAHEAVSYITERFHKAFPAHAEEARYGYAISSTMKPTQVEYPMGSLNQIPGQCTISGDIRLTPFYKFKDVVAFVNKTVQELNEGIDALPGRGPFNKYVLADGSRAKVNFEWPGEPSPGVACHLDGQGFKALTEATQAVLGSCKPSSLTGSLPCVAEMKEAGFDLQIVGYGVMKVYHATNEYASLAGFQRGIRILSRVIASLDKAV